MLCLGCRRPAAYVVCRLCFNSLRPSPERVLPPGIRVIAAFEHEGVAKRLVHQFKYQGVVGVADLVAEILAPSLPDLPLVPVPRAISRKIRYGIDPALELAKSISGRTGMPLVNAVAAPVHSARRAGHNRNRAPHKYRLRFPIPDRVQLVDDVVTTGTTLRATAAAIGPDRVLGAVAASTVFGMSNLSSQVTSPTRGRV